jgi:aspartyl-tRNA(Asn)/glutamyl-tRNA(Gln) amidotransferase subunit C
MSSREERDSPRPYGTRKRNWCSVPGLRFALSGAIFASSLREECSRLCIFRGGLNRLRKKSVLQFSSAVAREQARETPYTLSSGIAANGDDERMTAKVTVEEVERVAELAHLELTHDETGAMLHDLNAILEYVAELNELDTEGVAPLAQVTELMDVGGGGLREDAVVASLDRARVMAEAPETNGAFFKVPKVIER